MVDSSDETDAEVEQYRKEAEDAVEAGAGPKRQARAVMDWLEIRLSSMTDPLDEEGTLDAAGEVLVEIADDADATDEVMRYVEQKSSGIAGGKVTRNADSIRDPLIQPLRKLSREKVQKQLANSGSDKLSLDNGIGLDEYLEDYLESVERIETTDHVSNDVVYRFNFVDGASIECTDEWLTMFEFYPLVAPASNVEVKDEIVSDQALDRIDGDPNKGAAKKLLGKITLGPESRVWLSDNWNDCITNIVEEETETVSEEDKDVGPRTDAWYSLIASVGSSLAVRDLHDAHDNGVVHVHERDDGVEELWVPTSMVDTTCEDYAATRQSLAREVSARGAVSPEVSGNGASFKTVRTSPPSYWWRLESDHAEVEWPAEVRDEIGENEVFTGSSTDSDALADGGSMSFGGDGQ